jgi:hypothetical protein
VSAFAARYLVSFSTSFCEASGTETELPSRYAIFEASPTLQAGSAAVRPLRRFFRNADLAAAAEGRMPLKLRRREKVSTAVSVE